MLWVMRITGVGGSVRFPAVCISGMRGLVLVMFWEVSISGMRGLVLVMFREVSISRARGWS